MDLNILNKEIEFSAIRSGGPGGQHANKVSSKVVLTFSLQQSKAFSEEEKQLLYLNLKNKLTKENKLIVSSEATRSQHKNKVIALNRFYTSIKNALKIPKKRKPSKPSKSSIIKRLEQKKKHAIKKTRRRNSLGD